MTLRLLRAYVPGLAFAAITALAVIGIHGALNEDEVRPASASATAATTAIETPPDWIDYSIEQLDAASTIGDGRHYRIRAARLDHYRNDGSSELSEPRFTLHRNNGPARYSSAARGRLSADGTVLHLYGNVRMTDGAADGNAN